MMEDRNHTPVEQMDFFKRFVAVSNWVWNTIENWKPLAQDTVGKQLIRACDSIGANLVEGDGRYTDADGLRFFVIARASARETSYWLERAADRRLVTREAATEHIEEVTSATRLLNLLINYRRNRHADGRGREPFASYDAVTNDSDPFADPDFEPLTP